MGIPTWTVGEVLAAADVNAWFVPLEADKPSDQCVTSSAVFVNDSALAVTPAVNATYIVDCVIYYTAVSGADFKFQFTAPAGATFEHVATYVNTAGSFNQGVQQLTEPHAAQGNGTTVMSVEFTGTLVMGATAGNLQVQFAQNVSNATASISKQYSYLRARRVA